MKYQTLFNKNIRLQTTRINICRVVKFMLLPLRELAFFLKNKLLKLKIMKKKPADNFSFILKILILPAENKRY